MDAKKVDYGLECWFKLKGYRTNNGNWKHKKFDSTSALVHTQELTRLRISQETL